MRVFIAEANNPEDFYHEHLDGKTVQTLLNTIHVKNEFHMVLSPQYLETAIREAVEGGFDIFHLSCHGDDDGIAVVDNSLNWDTFAGYFQGIDDALPALVMSSCCGAARGIIDAFEGCSARPPFIYGSTEPLGYSQYCAAWAVLYHRLLTDGILKDAAQEAMEQVNAVVHDSFRYWRWDDKKNMYRRWPREGYTYRVREVERSKI
jgi:hypothetical protein